VWLSYAAFVLVGVTAAAATLAWLAPAAVACVALGLPECECSCRSR
jgi:hypothetical protein